MSQSIQAFTLGEIAVRQLNGLFSLNDLHRAAGAARRHEPARFIRLDGTKALIAELGAYPEMGTPSTDSQTPMRVINDGENNGTYACRELVIAYAAWISAAFHLKVIRVFLAVAAPTTPYSVQPGQTLSAEQAEALRNLLTSHVQKLPKDKQAAAMVKGWSKLKAHFKTDYRHIPAAEFHEAVSIIARHTAEWELVDDAPKAGTVQEIVADWVKKIESPNGYPAMLLEPIVEAVQRKMGRNQPAQPDAARTKAAFDAASQAAASVQSAVFNAVLSGNDEWKYSRWMLAFIDDSAKGSPAYVRQLEHGAFVTTWPRLVRDVGTGECMCTTAELLDMAYACMQRLAQRGATAKLAA